jgi:biopolymer transport protein ExbD
MRKFMTASPIVAMLITGCAASDAGLKEEIRDLREEVAALRAEIKELKQATVISEGLSIQLPPSAPKDASSADMVLTIAKSGSLILGSEQVTRDELRKRLTSLAAFNQNTRILIQADSSIPHQQVVEIMGLAKEAGIQHLGVVTDKTP